MMAIEDELVSYTTFWLIEDGQWFATVERDGDEIVRRGPFATEAEAKKVSDAFTEILERGARRAWQQR